MQWRLSVGARWALRYTLAMAATLAVFAVVIQAVAKQKSDQAAALLARTQATELLDALETRARAGSAAEYEKWSAEHTAHRVAQADPELGLGIRLLAFDGRLRHDAGSLRGVAVALPPEVARGRAPLAVSSGRLGSAGRFFVASAAAPAGFLQVAVSTRHWELGLAALRNVMLAALPLMLLLSGVSGFLLARRSLASVDEITRIADHLSSANLHETIPVTGSGDELDRLAVTLNAMLGRIRAGVEQMHRFNANAAHELRTPLHRIGSMLDAALAQPRDAAQYRDALFELRGEVNALRPAGVPDAERGQRRFAANDHRAGLGRGVRFVLERDRRARQQSEEQGRQAVRRTADPHRERRWVRGRGSVEVEARVRLSRGCRTPRAPPRPC